MLLKNSKKLLKLFCVTAFIRSNMRRSHEVHASIFWNKSSIFLSSTCWSHHYPVDLGYWTCYLYSIYVVILHFPLDSCFKACYTYYCYDAYVYKVTNDVYMLYSI